VYGGIALSLITAAIAHAAEPAPGTPERPLLVANSVSAGPVVGMGPDGKLFGIRVETLDLVAARAGIALRQVSASTSWPRAQALVQRGEADVLVTLPIPEREAYAIFTRNPLYRDDDAVVFCKQGPKAARIAAAKTLRDLDGLAFVVTKGNGWAKTALAGQNVTWARDEDLAVGMLPAGHADVFFYDLITARALVAKPGLEDSLSVHRLDDPTSAHIHVGIRRSLEGSESLIARLDAAIEAAERDGSLEAVRRRYGETGP
jgi:ABC-type amino acid transport substrate-binding protein